MKIKFVAATVALSFALNALPALADSKDPTPAERRGIGARVGFVAGAGTTGAYLYGKETGGIRLRKTSPGAMKDAAGRLDRHTNPEFNKKYLDTYGKEHARKIDEAKRKQAGKNLAKKKALDARDLKDKKLAKENPAAVKHLKKERALGEQFNAQRKHERDMKKLNKLAGKNAKIARKNQRIVKKTAKKTVKVAKSATKLRKLKTVGKVAAGGAAGAVAGAAMGEHIPDVFEATAYTYKMARNPKDAPKMLYGTAKGGVAMAGRMALTVTDPGKMARNLGGAAQGVGRSIANTGVYKSMARTKTGRIIGKATGYASAKVSQGYKSFARSKTGKTAGAVAKTVDKYTFKQANKGVKVTTKAVSKGSKVVAKVAKKEAKKAKKTAKKVGKALKKAFHL
jgi:histone H1/5